MQESGYIKLNRNISEWRYIDCPYAFALWIHLLRLANWKPGYFRGKKVPRGSFVTSLRSLERETGISHNTIQKWLRVFEQEGQIRTERTNSGTQIWIVNFDGYQGDRGKIGTPTGTPTGTELTNERVEIGTPTGTQTGDNRRIVRRKRREEKEGCVTPPTLDEVRDYVKENNYSVDPDRFFTYYKSSDWKDKNGRSFEWKAKIDLWEIDDRKKKDGQNRSHVSIKVPDYIEAQERGEFDRDLSKWLGKETS